VALGCRILDLEEQGDLIWGHVSARDPDGRGIWMKGAGRGFDEVGPEHVLLVSWDGEVLEGDGRRHVEYPIHTELLRARPDVGAVVHTHAPWSVAFAATGQPLRPVSHEGTLFVPPDVARFTETGDLIVSRELGASVAATVGGRNAALLVHHGIVCCGADVKSAVMTAVFLERACRTQIRATAGGGPASWSSDEEALAKREHVYDLAQAFDYLARRVERR
jgi:L-fuculose-phosphate aldolase